MKRVAPSFLILLASSCAAPPAASPASGSGGEGRTSVTSAEAEATPGEPFELQPDDVKLTLAFEGGAPLCSGRTSRDASGKYVVDFARKTVRVSGTDACGGPFRRESMLPTSARAQIAELVQATKTPKEVASFGAGGEIAQARCTMTLTRKNGNRARFGSGAPDPHEGHAPRMRGYLDSLLR